MSEPEALNNLMQDDAEDGSTKKECPLREPCRKLVENVSPKVTELAKKVSRIPFGKVIVVTYALMAVCMGAQALRKAHDGYRTEAVTSGILSALWTVTTVLAYINEKTLDVEEDEAMDDGVEL